jgi:5-methylcytosine-specific restriction protein A
MPTRPPIFRPKLARSSQRLEPKRSPESIQANRWRNRAGWERFRARHLEEHPLCADCLQAGRYETAVEVHHAGKRLAARLQAGACGYSDVLSLCTSCHSARTARGE